jgi:hypothetical protein
VVRPWPSHNGPSRAEFLGPLTVLVVRVELHSAITGKVSEIARMRLWNDGTGTSERGSYSGTTHKGRIERPGYLAGYGTQGPVMRTARVEGYPRQSKHVWNLVAKMLHNMGYK